MFVNFMSGCQIGDDEYCWKEESAYGWSRIHWEKQTRVFDLIVETHPRH
jgi:hypothetical protein